MTRIDFNLAPQARHPVIHRPVICSARTIPPTARDLFSRHDLAGLRAKQIKQIGLQRRQVHGVAIAGHQTAVGRVIKAPAKGHEPRNGGRNPGNQHGAPQHGFQPRPKFRRLDRFGEVIVGAHFKSDDSVRQATHRRQHDNGTGMFGPKPTDQG